MLNSEEIRQISTGIDHHLVQLEKFIGTMRDIKQSIDELRHLQENKFLWELQLVKQEIVDMKRQLNRYGLPEISQYEKEIENLKELLSNDLWPEAIHPDAICDSSQKVEQQSEMILDFIVGEYLKDKKFLDYGCNNRYTVQIATKREVRLAMSYNLHEDFNEIAQNAPFDIILAYDVLDHIKDPIQALQQMKSVLAKNGRIFLCNHPWSARHGSHLYKKTNKAFIHLVFDEVELTRLLGCQTEFNLKIIRPLETYRHWIKQAGLELKSEIPIKKPVSPIFLEHPYIHKRLMQLWQNETEIETNIEIEFVEYILENPVDLSIL